MTRLRTILDEATALLARNNADVGARVQKAEMDLGALSGKLEEARHLLEQLQKQQTEGGTRLGALEQGQQKIVDRVAPAMADDPQALWKQAQERMASGMREDARRFFRGFISVSPRTRARPRPTSRSASPTRWRENTPRLRLNISGCSMPSPSRRRCRRQCGRSPSPSST